MYKYKLGIYEKAIPGTLSWKEMLTVAQECGYDYFEISIDETNEKLKRLDWSKKERKLIYDLSQEVGMPFESICLSAHRKYPLGSTTESVRIKSIEILEKACVLACDLGIRYIMLAGYDVYYEPSSKQTKAFFIQGLKTCCEIASKYGVVLAFETMETPFMDTVEKAMKYVKEINSPYLQIYPDIGNVNNATLLYNISYENDIKAGKGHMLAVHIKETKPGCYREVPFGTGVVDFENMLYVCWKNKIRRYVTEFWYVGQKDWKEDLQQVNKFARNILSKLEKIEEEG